VPQFGCFAGWKNLSLSVLETWDGQDVVLLAGRCRLGLREELETTKDGNGKYRNNHCVASKRIDVVKPVAEQFINGLKWGLNP